MLHCVTVKVALLHGVTMLLHHVACCHIIVLSLGQTMMRVDDSGEARVCTGSKLMRVGIGQQELQLSSTFILV